MNKGKQRLMVFQSLAKQQKDYRKMRNGIRDNVLETVRQEIVPRATSSMLAAMCLYLHDKEGYGRKRLQRAYNGICEIIDDIENERLSFEDVLQTIHDEFGIEFSWKGYLKKSDDSKGDIV